MLALHSFSKTYSPLQPPNHRAKATQTAPKPCASHLQPSSTKVPLWHHPHTATQQRGPATPAPRHQRHPNLHEAISATSSAAGPLHPAPKTASAHTSLYTAPPFPALRAAQPPGSTPKHGCLHLDPLNHKRPSRRRHAACNYHLHDNNPQNSHERPPPKPPPTSTHRRASVIRASNYRSPPPPTTSKGPRWRFGLCLLFHGLRKRVERDACKRERSGTHGSFFLFGF
ncbi:hypothetical protein VNO80_05666 [Phaseolus coccineus]|uniref:Uncharacterized protein n=1 Tax=Phaseolus coccineus TaxID=3886 RepID=A0AAN9RGX4_PHACN